MKRMKKMILLLGVLVLVLGGYMLMNRQQETASVQEESGTFALTARTAEELSGLEWTKEEQSFSFIRTDGVWKKADNDAYPVAQDVLETLADQLIGLEANRKLENVTDASIYGLAQPAFTVTAKWSDGSSTIYQMGDETPFGDGYYLSLAEESGTAYTTSASLSGIFSKSMNDFADMETIPAVAEVRQLTIGDVLDATWQEESATLDEAQHWYAADGRALDGVDALISDYEALEWAGLVEAVATDEQLAQWKLDAESAVAVTCRDGEDSASVLFGATDENGDYYARLPESTMVYTVAADSVSELLSATTEKHLSLALADVEYAKLQEAVLTAGDVSLTIAPLAEAAEGEAEAEEAQVDPSEELWKQFAALKASEHVSDAEGGETLLTVSVTAKTGISAVFTFIEYDAEHYLVTDGERTMLTAADAVDKLIRTLKNM